jgi:hypothetical protein
MLARAAWQADADTDTDMDADMDANTVGGAPGVR